MYEIKTKDVYEDFSNDKNNDKEHKKAKGEMNVFIYINRCIHYTIKKKQKKLDVRQAPKYVKGTWD